MTIYTSATATSATTGKTPTITPATAITMTTPHCTSTTGTQDESIDVSEKPALSTEDESIGVLKSLLAPHGVKRAAGPGNNIEKEITNNGLWTISADPPF